MDNTTFTVPQETTQTAVTPQQPAETLQPGQGPPVPQKRHRPGRRKKIIKNCIGAGIALLVVGALVWLTYIVFFKPPPEYYLTGRIEIGDAPIKNMINGWGYLQPESSETVTITESGTVLESHMWPGAPVRKDDILLVLDSSSIDKAVEGYSKQIGTLESEIEALGIQIEKVYGQLQEANAEQYAMARAARMTAPFSGSVRIADHEKLLIGQEIYKGQPLGMLVDDTQMKLTLYFSYGYEHDIFIGQSCEVSIPAVMSTAAGWVSGIEKTRRAYGGTISFEVEVTIDNPGALDDTMDATASMRSASGEIILPVSEKNQLRYAREEILASETKGTLKQNNLRDFYSVRAGDLLIEVDFTPDTSIEEGYMLTINAHEAGIEAKREQIEALYESIELEYERMDDLIIRSPIDGVVMSWTDIWPGMTVSPGMMVTVAQMETLTLHGEVYQSDVQKISEGMDVSVDAWVYGEMTTIPGVLTKIDRTASQMGGGAYYPVIISVDNRQGQLMEGSGANFQIILDISEENPILIPTQAVQGVGKTEYVFVRPPDGKRPENAEDLPEGIVPPGFYAIRIKTGMYNIRSTEVLEGIPREWEGWEVFTQKTDTLPSPGPSFEFDIDIEDLDPLDAFEKGYQKGLEDAANETPGGPDDPIYPGGDWEDPFRPDDGGWEEPYRPDDGGWGEVPEDGYFDDDGNWIPLEPIDPGGDSDDDGSDDDGSDGGDERPIGGGGNIVGGGGFVVDGGGIVIMPGR